MTTRIAMWSGPRNISTAMMRSWGNRADTFVCDEPLYAYYLDQTKLDHPGADEIVAHHENDAARVIEWLTGPVPGDRPVFYQKHMAHHLLPELDRAWLGMVTNCFLIRDPKEMITSLMKVIPNPRDVDTGLPQQVEIFERVRAGTGATPPVLDSRDVLDDPKGMLAALCDAVGLDYTDDMLAWPAGPRDTDGVWAKHWYANVEKSTGFAPYTPKNEPVPNALAHVYEACCAHYDTLYTHRLTT